MQMLKLFKQNAQVNSALKKSALAPNGRDRNLGVVLVFNRIIF